MEKKNITPGPWTAATQKGNPGHCYAAQVFDNTGYNLATLEPTEEGSEASANAELIAEAGTVFHESGLTPMELLTQRNELLDVCKSINLPAKLFIKSQYGSNYKGH